MLLGSLSRKWVSKFRLLKSVRLVETLQQEVSLSDGHVELV